MVDEDQEFDVGLLNLGALGLISALTLIFFITYWEAYSLFEEALLTLLGGEFTALGTVYGVVRFATMGLGLWSLAALIAGVALRDVRVILHGASLGVPSILLIYLLNMIEEGVLSGVIVVAMFILLFSIEQVLGGVAGGLIVGGRLRPSKGDWKGVIRGLRLAILGVLMIFPSVYIYLQSIAESNLTGLTLQGSTLDLVMVILPFLEAYILIYLAMWIPLALLFVKCRRCKAVLWKRGMLVAGWDSEHTLRHRHCPRCGAMIDL